MARGSASSTVTSAPRLRAEEAISSPITPAPMQMTRRAVGQPGADQPRILDSAQIQRLVAAVDGQMPRPAADGEQQPIVVEAPPIGQPDAVRRGIEFGGLGAQQQFDPLLFVAVGRVEIRDRRFGLVGQHRLGQRRPLVGPPGLVADQQDPAGIARLAHGHRGPAAGLARADDDMRHRAGGALSGSQASVQPVALPGGLSLTWVRPSPWRLRIWIAGRLCDDLAIGRLGVAAAHPRRHVGRVAVEVVFGTAEHGTRIEPRPDGGLRAERLRGGGARFGRDRLGASKITCCANAAGTKASDRRSDQADPARIHDADMAIPTDRGDAV